MSKNMTRKGLAFGAGFALVATGLAAAPAQAAVESGVTLVPTAGETFNSILQSGITLQTEMDSTLVGGSTNDQDLIYLIGNPGADSITLKIDSTFNGTFTQTTGDLNQKTAATAFTNGSAAIGNDDDDLLTTTAKHIAIGSPSSDYATPVALEITTSETTDVSLTVQAVVDLDQDGFADTFERVSPARTVTLYAPGNVSATTVLSDMNVGADDFKATVTYGQNINPYMVQARTGVRILKDGSAVEPGTDENNDTDLFGMDINAAPTAGGNPGVAANTLVTGVVASDGNFEADTQEVIRITGVADPDGTNDYALDLPGVAEVVVANPAAAGANDQDDLIAALNAGQDVATVSEDGDGVLVITYDAIGNQTDATAAAFQIATDGDPDTNEGTLTVATQGNASNLSADATAGVYTAVAFYDTKASVDLNSATSLVQMGAGSRAFDLTAGASSLVDGMDVLATNTANQKRTTTDANELQVREGTTSATFTLQLTDNNVTLQAANVEVRAIVTETALDADAEITISGGLDTLTDGGPAIVGYARTDSAGKASFTITSANGKKDDAIDIALAYKDEDGSWDAVSSQANGGVDNGLDVKWFEATRDSFTALPAAYVSGANPTVTFQVKDQWGQMLDFIDDTRLSVYASAYIGGVEDAETYAERVTVQDGIASFSFANFATAGSTAELRAVLYKGATTSEATLNVTVYNTADTSEITVANSFKTDITYTDYVTGVTTDSAVAQALIDTGLGADTTRAEITGNVLNSDGIGQPGTAVVISTDEALFYDVETATYAQNEITVYANEFGAFDVFAYTHTVATTGQTVSIEADGVSAETLLVSYLPKDELDRDVLNFSWDLPATMVMNTTYAVTAKLTDKWGNPVKTDGATGSVQFDGNGAVQVNGIAGSTTKDFNADGEVTVFVRSIKDIAGPGEVTATLLQVASQYSIDPTVDEAGNGGSLGADQFGTLASTSTDVISTEWDETLFDKTLTAEFDVLETAPAAADAKVNAGSFKGYVAVYAKGYEGQRLSAKIGNDWVIVDPIVNNQENGTLHRTVDFTGAGVDIAVRIYIDRVLVDTINLTTK